MTSPAPVVTGLIARITTWLWRLAVLTGTWWLQTLAGAVILGIGPATLTLHRRLRAMLLGGDEASMREAWALWRRDFADAQLRIGVPFLTVVVIGWYLLALRGTPLAVSVAILGAVYLLWLQHLPAVAASSNDERATGTWLLTARMIARQPVTSVLAGAVPAVAIVALIAWFPGGLVLAVPTIPAVCAALAVRRSPRQERT